MGIKMGSETTTKTEIPPPTEQEQNFLNMVSNFLLPAYLNESGYETKPRQTKFEESSSYQALVNKRDRELKENGGYKLGEVQIRNRFERDVERARRDFVPTTTYDLRKKENAELEYLKGKYGAGSKEYKSAKKKFAKEEVASFQQQERIYKEFQNRTEKFLKGDFSISPEQEAVIQKNNEPVKKAIETMFKDNLAESGKTFDDFNREAEKAGMSFSQAMGSVVDQIKTTGIEMERALKNVVSTRQELLKQGIDDYTGEITKRVATNAAAMGRDPSDPEFTADIAAMVAKEARAGNLELANLEAQGLMGIRERTGGKLEEAAAQKGSALVDYESNISNMRTQIGGGMAPQMLAAGQGGHQYSQALALQRLQNAAGTAQFPMFFTGYQQRERMAQPTTTQSTPFGPQDAIGLGLGIAGAGANIYGAMSSAKFLQGFGGSGGGGYTPTRLF